MKPEMHVLGIDIAKRVFHAVGMDDRGNIVYRKRLSRHDLIPCIAQLPAFSANNPPAHARETVWKSLPGAGLRAGAGG